MPTPLGPRIKALRKESGLTLTALADKTGLSVGFLSNLERDETSPTIANLHKICDALGATLNDILDSGEPEGKVTVVRASERKTLFEQADGMLSYSAVTTGDTEVGATAMTLKSESWVLFSPHDHDELGIIASGSMELDVDGQKVILEQGDSIYIKSGTMHSGRVKGSEPCVSYWIKNSSSHR
ncbi:MAG: helix-turn-helix domain-containing protein [Coriobacteriales bacterium]|jgi:transcriptional regulator with XRE-family HTH domain